MEVRFEDEDLERLEKDPLDSGRDRVVARAFVKQLRLIRTAVDERAFFQWKSMRFEKLVGDRVGQYAIRLNDQWRLIFRFEGEGPKKVVVVKEIADYHK